MDNRILVVDDDRTDRTLVAGLLQKEYAVTVAGSGEEALALAAAQTPALVLLDLVMPGIDGYETCRRLKTYFPGENIQVIIISGASSEEEQVQAYQCGADAYLVKPIDSHVLRSQVRLHFRLREAMGRIVSGESPAQAPEEEVGTLIAAYHRHLGATQDVAVFALAKLAESRDADTGNHVLRVRDYSLALAEQLRQDSPYAPQIDEQFLADLHRSAVLHDIGKVGISDTILFKPGRLTPEEFEIIKMHTVLGARVLEETVLHNESGSFLRMAVAIVKHHHEWYDGTGYPDGLRGQAIPLPARLVAVADVFDALSSPRPYKPAYALEYSQRLVREDAGKHFDPLIITAFDACTDAFAAVHRQRGAPLSPATPAVCGPDRQGPDLPEAAFTTSQG